MIDLYMIDRGMIVTKSFEFITKFLNNTFSVGSMFTIGRHSYIKLLRLHENQNAKHTQLVSAGLKVERLTKVISVLQIAI